MADILSIIDPKEKILHKLSKVKDAWRPEEIQFLTGCTDGDIKELVAQGFLTENGTQLLLAKDRS